LSEILICVECNSTVCKLKLKDVDIALYGKPISQLRSVTCHMGSHSVTCHPTQVNVPCLNPRQIGRYLICLPWRDKRLSWPRWLVTYRDGLPARLPSSTNPAWHRVTSLVGRNALPLRNATNPNSHTSMKHLEPQTVETNTQSQRFPIMELLTAPFSQ